MHKEAELWIQVCKARQVDHARPVGGAGGATKAGDHHQLGEFFAGLARKKNG